MYLGKPLLWVESVKRLCTTLTNNGGCTLNQDLLEKRAMYIAKNNELNQEFFFAHPNTKLWINNIYNTSFYGAPLWDLTSRNFEKLEKNMGCDRKNVNAQVLDRTTNRNTAYYQVNI